MTLDGLQSIDSYCLTLEGQLAYLSTKNLIAEKIYSQENLLQRNHLGVQMR